mgnify:CR=1 FL=1
MQEDKIKKVYGLFDEEKSKYIYENRAMYSLTGAKKFIDSFSNIPSQS